MQNTVNDRIYLEQVFGLDVGRGYVEAINGLMQTTQFESYCVEGWEMSFNDIQPGQLVVKYIDGDYTKAIGKSYFVGQLAYIQKGKLAKRMTANKVTTETLIMGLTALFQLGANGNTYICTGVPNQEYNSQHERLVELFQGTHTIEVNGTRRTIRIRQCLVTIETGVFILHLQNGEKIRIIDPGAKTTDLVTLFMGQYVDDESTTINQGWETKGGGRKGVEPFARLIVGEAGDLDWDESDPIIYVIGGRAGDIVEPIKEEGFSHAKLPDDLPMARDLNGKEFQLDASWVNAYCYLLAIKGALGIAS